MKASPGFLQRADREFFQLPYTIEKAQMLALVIRAPDAAHLAQSFIDPTLNEAAGTPGRFVPELGGHFVLGHIFYPHVAHSSPDFGAFSYTESVIYLPVRDTQAQLGEPFSYWFTPVMLLDSYYALIAGREIYGIPKLLSRHTTTPQPLADLLDMPDPQGAANVEIESFVTQSKTEMCAMHPIWSLRITGESGSLLENIVGHAVDDLINIHLPRPLDLIDDVWSSLLRLMGPLNPGIFVKQFPAEEDTSLADFRSLVRARYTPTALHRIRLLKGEATFQSPASFPIAQELGFAPDTPIPAELAFIAEMDWLIPAGENLPGQPDEG